MIDKFILYGHTHLVSFEDDEYHVKTTMTLKEDEELLKSGFEYARERDGVKIYRKRKCTYAQHHRGRNHRPESVNLK